MRITKTLFYSVLLFAFVFQSCSIEKRRYTSGYSLQWKKNNRAVKTDNPEEELTQTKQPAKKIDVVNVIEEPTPSIKNINALTASSEKKKGIVLFVPDSTGCDTIIMRNETEIKVKVIEITPTEVKYKYCDNLTGPMYVSYRYEVSYIKYANGKLESFKDEFAPIIKTLPSKQVGSSSSSYGGSNYIDSRNNEKAKKTSLMAMIFSCIALVPFFGIPAIFIGMFTGLRALKLIRRNPRELEMYRTRSLVAIAIAAIVLLLYIVLLGYLIIQSGGLLQFLI